MGENEKMGKYPRYWLNSIGKVEKRDSSMAIVRTLYNLAFPHPLTPSPKKGEGEPGSKSLSRSGREIYGEGGKTGMHPRERVSSFWV